MVTVKYVGRLGNRMFQYALGRYLAQEMNYELRVRPLPFPRTQEKIRGQIYLRPDQILQGHNCDLLAILNDQSQRSITLNGYFQQSRFYLPVMKEIKEWFALPMKRPFALREVSPLDILVYIRLGDYYKCGVSLTHHFYESAINMARPRRVFIATDEPTHPFLKKFRHYDPVIICSANNPEIDLCAAQYFNKVAISCSSFSWWAAILSHANEIYVPIAKSGWWSGCNNHPIDAMSIDLRVDEDRFIYLYNCSVLKSLNYSTTFLPLSQIKPDLNTFHRYSTAWWFQNDPI